jgi:2-dehydropantoate 2-reductase
MRFVVFGAGGIGGVIGARLAQHGHDVLLIARGAQYAALRQHGLQIESPDAVARLDVPVVEHPEDITWSADDVVLLTMKTQDTLAALRDLAAAAPLETPVVCVQNGVENERLAARWFTRVYGVCVMCPTTYLTPGIVQAWSSPTTGILDIGCYPAGVDSTAETVVAAVRASTFVCEARPDIMRWKYGKLLLNLGNAVEALCGPAARQGPIGAQARREGLRCLEAAGIAYVAEDEDAARRGNLLRLRPIAGQKRGGGSSWQSLQRRARSIETDYLNGEIALLGRLHGVATPVNALLQRLANRLARDSSLPGTMSAEGLLRELGSEYTDRSG